MSAPYERTVDWRTRTVEAAGGRLAFAEAGGGRDSSGVAPSAAIVLLHGFTGSHRSWDGVLEVWRPAARVLAPDLPGHGGSDFGVDPALHSFENTACALDAMLDAVAVGACTLVGYSMGGRLALYYALTRPARVGRLVLESARPGLPTEPQRQARRRSDAELAEFALREGIEAFVERWEDSPVLAAERELADLARRGQREQRLGCSTAGLAASLRGMGAGSQPWLGGRLSELVIPTLLLAGACDAKFSSLARTMAGHIASCELAIIEGAGHNVHLALPATFARLVDAFVGTASHETEADGRTSHAAPAEGVNR